MKSQLLVVCNRSIKYSCHIPAKVAACVEFIFAEKPEKLCL
ncbi:hypothetical protein Hanom_Chr14g01280751 [Helianthus anomalus]